MHLVMSMSYLVVLLAEAAVDALGHVDVVSGGPPGAVRPLLGLDSDGLGGTDGLAQLAGDTSLLSRGVPPESVFSSEPGRQRPLLEGVVDGCGLLEDVAESDGHAAAQLSDEERVGGGLGELPPAGDLRLGRIDEHVVSSRG